MNWTEEQEKRYGKLSNKSKDWMGSIDVYKNSDYCIKVHRPLNRFQKLMNKLFGFYKEKPVELTILKKEGESWMDVTVRAAQEKFQKDSDYMFGLTHYDWMYRATGDEKYLEEQQKYIRDNKK